MNEAFLNKNRVTRGRFHSTYEDGFNGAFEFTVLGTPIRVIASDGEGWRHISVTQACSNKPPNWDVMCAVKDLFWDHDEIVVQFHPKKSEYVNNHPGCLHLWRVTDGREFPTPNSLLVGIKGIERPTRDQAKELYDKAMRVFMKGAPH